MSILTMRGGVGFATPAIAFEEGGAEAVRQALRPSTQGAWEAPAAVCRQWAQ